MHLELKIAAQFVRLNKNPFNVYVHCFPVYQHDSIFFKKRKVLLIRFYVLNFVSTKDFSQSKTAPLFEVFFFFHTHAHTNKHTVWFSSGNKQLGSILRYADKQVWNTIYFFPSCKESKWTCKNILLLLYKFRNKE